MPQPQIVLALDLPPELLNTVAPLLEDAGHYAFAVRTEPDLHAMLRALPGVDVLLAPGTAGGAGTGRLLPLARALCPAARLLLLADSACHPPLPPPRGQVGGLPAPVRAGELLRLLDPGHASTRQPPA